MDAHQAKDDAESEGTASTHKTRRAVMVTGGLLIGVVFLFLITWKVSDAIHNNNLQHQQTTTVQAGNTAPPAQASTYRADLRGSVTMDVASYHVTTDAIFDRSGPGNRATCMWPEYYSSAYQQVVIHKSGGDVTFNGGVQAGSDPGGAVRSIYVKAWPGQPVDAQTQLKHWGSDCGDSPTDAATEAQLQAKADAGN